MRRNVKKSDKCDAWVSGIESPGENLEFLPETLILPVDWEKLKFILAKSALDEFWIVKPSNLNRGLGIRSAQSSF